MMLEVCINSWRLQSSMNFIFPNIGSIYNVSLSIFCWYQICRFLTYYTIVEIETGILLSFKNNIVFHAISTYNIILLAEMKTKNNVKKLFIKFETDYTASGNQATFYYNLKSKSQMHKQKQISFEKQMMLLLRPYISNHSVIQKNKFFNKQTPWVSNIHCLKSIYWNLMPSINFIFEFLQDTMK